eukprot:tig00020902_g14994.t1
MSSKKDKAMIAEQKKKIKDPEAVLRGVTRLGEEMKKAPKRKATSAAELGYENVLKEVRDMVEEDVSAEIEKIVMQTVRSILAGEGFSYTVPSKSSSNHLYVPELDRIVLKNAITTRAFANASSVRKTAITTRVMQLIYELCSKKIHVTKRDLFYTDVNLFQRQEESDDVLNDVACMVGSTRTSLNVVASDKGIVVGRITFRDDGDLIDGTKMGTGGKAPRPTRLRPPRLIAPPRPAPPTAAFMRLAEDRFYNKYPCIIITAKGQPDVATRLFLRKLRDTLNIPILGLVDSDPYGLKILSVYMSGSKAMAYDSANLTTPDIKWLGVRPSDLERYSVPKQCRIAMTEKASDPAGSNSG